MSNFLDLRFLSEVYGMLRLLDYEKGGISNILFKELDLLIEDFKLRTNQETLHKSMIDYECLTSLYRVFGMLRYICYTEIELNNVVFSNMNNVIFNMEKQVQGFIELMNEDITDANG